MSKEVKYMVEVMKALYEEQMIQHCYDAALKQKADFIVLAFFKIHLLKYHYKLERLEQECVPTTNKKQILFGDDQRSDYCPFDKKKTFQVKEGNFWICQECKNKIKEKP